jgi:hypothetical protein
MMQLRNVERPPVGATGSYLVLCYCVQSAGGLNDALLRASAEHAAQAILMSPLVSHDYDNEDQRLASRVMTGTSCAGSVYVLIT